MPTIKKIYCDNINKNYLNFSVKVNLSINVFLIDLLGLRLCFLIFKKIFFAKYFLICQEL